MYKIGDISSTYCSGNNEAKVWFLTFWRQFQLSIKTWQWIVFSSVNLTDILYRFDNWPLYPCYVAFFKKNGLRLCCYNLPVYLSLYVWITLSWVMPEWFSFFFGGGGGADLDFADLDFSIVNIRISIKLPSSVYLSTTLYSSISQWLFQPKICAVHTCI